MKLVPKLSLAFMVGVSLILAVNGYFRVRREVAMFESDRVRDDRLIGQALAAAVKTVWHTDGEGRALAMVGEAGEHEGRVRVRWVWLDGPTSSLRPADYGKVEALTPGASFTCIGAESPSDQRRFTFVRAAVPGIRRGVIEVSEPLADEHGYIQRTIIDTIATAFTLDAFCALLAMTLGVWIVGRPVSALIEKARNVGRGDFGHPLKLSQNDELAEIAVEMNAMCEHLIEANERAAAETRARIEVLEQLRHADRLMTVGKLASGVAHELGTPLNVVEARAAMVASGETTPEESANYARIIIRASEQMTRIIRQLLAFARPRAPQKSRCDLGQVARRTVELLKPLADKKQITLRISGATDTFADADAGQMEQAFTNLLMNAIQASTDSGTVDVTAERTHAKPPPAHDIPEGQYVRVSVRDTGPGISPEHLAHVFEPFFTTKDVGEGTGLGLSVTYGIVREHRGWIHVASEPGQGAEFSVYVPAAKND